jgi:hypothetical protein
MKEVIYDHTTLNINLCNIIDLYSIIRPRCYSEELLKKTSHILCMLEMLNKYNLKYLHIQWSNLYDEWLCVYN